MAGVLAALEVMTAVAVLLAVVDVMADVVECVVAGVVADLVVGVAAVVLAPLEYQKPISSYNKPSIRRYLFTYQGAQKV